MASNAGIIAVALIIVGAVGAFLPVVPVAYTVLEPYTVEETYFEKVRVTKIEKYIEIEEVSRPELIREQVAYHEEIQTEWTVTWRTLTGDLRVGSPVGTSTFPSEFNFDWEFDAVFAGFNDFIHFEALATIDAKRSGPVTFIIGSDDGSRLYIDGILRIDNWGDHSYIEMSAVVNLSPGPHSLRMLWYDHTRHARVSFSTTDDSILSWEVTRTSTVERIVEVIEFVEVEKEREVVVMEDVERTREVIKHREVARGTSVSVVDYITGNWKRALGVE